MISLNRFFFLYLSGNVHNFLLISSLVCPAFKDDHATTICGLAKDTENYG